MSFPEADTMGLDMLFLRFHREGSLLDSSYKAVVGSCSTWCQSLSMVFNS